MERRKFFGNLGTGTLASLMSIPFMAGARVESETGKRTNFLKKEEIQHMVIFNLHHEQGSELAMKFLYDGRNILSNIPKVNNFQVFSQVSLKNDYSYGFSMVFDCKADYDSYSNHPDHLSFVENRWKKEVEKFMEIDFKAL